MVFIFLYRPFNATVTTQSSSFAQLAGLAAYAGSAASHRNPQQGSAMQQHSCAWACLAASALSSALEHAPSPVPSPPCLEGLGGSAAPLLLLLHGGLTQDAGLSNVRRCWALAYKVCCFSLWSTMLDQSWLVQCLWMKEDWHVSSILAVDDHASKFEI